MKNIKYSFLGLSAIFILISSVVGIEYFDLPDRWVNFDTYKTRSEIYTYLGTSCCQNWSSEPTEFNGVLHDSSEWWMEQHFLSYHELELFYLSNSSEAVYRLSWNLRFVPSEENIVVEEGVIDLEISSTQPVAGGDATR